ncbi:MAG: phosphoribosylglycinamide formyltransferase [Bacteroidota bacterium]|nr:phosphoribosylglycinamide formyltransferase [Bacteroidota bacterium]
MKKIAILASGSGTNAENIARFFRKEKTAIVALILSNNKDAYVLRRAEKLEIPYITFNREDFYSSDRVLNILQDHRIDLIVLAGFLWLIPRNILKAFPKRIVNIHPALLPGYGGKGMYGDSVHKAVIENGEKESGISIHYVNEKYDEGEIIFQARCPLSEQDTAESLAGRIHELEYKHFPEVINRLVKDMD